MRCGVDTLQRFLIYIFGMIDFNDDREYNIKYPNGGIINEKNKDSLYDRTVYR